MLDRSPIYMVTLTLPGSLPFWAQPYLGEWLWPITLGSGLVVGLWVAPRQTGFVLRRSVEAVSEGLSLVATLVGDLAHGGRRVESVQRWPALDMPRMEGPRAPVAEQREPAGGSRGAQVGHEKRAEPTAVEPRSRVAMGNGADRKSTGTPGAGATRGNGFTDYLDMRSMTQPGADDGRECKAIGNRLVEALKSHGIRWELKGAQIRPAWYVFGFSPEKGVLGVLPKKVEEDLPRIACCAKVQPTRFSGSTWVGLAVPRPKPAVLGLREVLESEAWQRIAGQATLPWLLGPDPLDPKDLIVWDLAKVYQIAAGGKTGSGKTSWLQAALLSLAMVRSAREFRATLLDPKRVLEKLHSLPHVRRVEFGVEQILEVLEERVREMDERYAQLPGVGCDLLVEYNAAVPADHRLPHEVIVLDEYPNLLRTAAVRGLKLEIENAVNALTEKGGAAGFHVVLLAQKTTTDVMDSATVNNCEPIAFQMGTPAASRALLRNKGGAELLPGKGAGLCFRGEELSRFQAPLVEKHEVVRVVTAMAAYAPQKPVPMVTRGQ